MAKNAEPAPGNGLNGLPASDRRHELVTLAGRLFAEKGFLATTIRDVADAAGIQSGSLYHHFSSKESIADELLRGYWSDLITNYEAVISANRSATEEARGLITESVLLLESRELAVRMSTNDWNYLSGVFPYMDESLNRCEEIWIATLKRGVKEGEFSAQVDPTIMYRTIMAAVGGTARWWRPDGPIKIRELAADFADLFMQGIAARD